MASVVVDGIEHIYAPNPKMATDTWANDFPPIVTNARWLRNKYTGEILPNHEEFAVRSDILEPYYGENGDELLPSAPETVGGGLDKAVAQPASKPVSKQASQPEGELLEL